MEAKKIYLAGPLFNAAEISHNLNLAEALKNLGYKVILPQARALNFKNPDGSFDLDGLRDDCRSFAGNNDFILVANLDGSDADSGTSNEIGIRVGIGGWFIAYRTDFRTYLPNELGINAMNRPNNPENLIYEPAGDLTSLIQVKKFYKKLAEKIHQTIQNK